MGDLVYKYTLDLTGKSPDHFIMNEAHTLVNGANRAVVPRYGAFYTRDLVVRDVNDGRVLTLNDDYVPVMYYEEPSTRSGLEVCSGIVITDGTCSSNVSIDYRVVGGDYANISAVIIDLIENLNLDERTVAYGDLLGAPNTFPPTHHLHDMGDIYGFEFLTQAADRIREAILVGDQESHNEIYNHVEARYDALTAALLQLRTEFITFSERTDNPHQVTKAQVGLGVVENYPPASRTEAEEGVVSNRYLTPITTKQAIDYQIGNVTRAHMNNVGNPHSVTKAQVGLGVVENYPIANNTEAVAGTISNKYVVPSTMKAAIASQALVPLNAHMADTGNPHSVTKAQVGLGSVQNYPVANNTEAIAGTISNKYVVPSTMKAAIASQAGNALKTHTDRTDNPHSVTKAQVGLSKVDNYSRGDYDNRYVMRDGARSYYAQDFNHERNNTQAARYITGAKYFQLYVNSQAIYYADKDQWVSYRNFRPDADNTRNLGSASYRWRNIYGVSIHGAFYGNGTNLTNLDASKFDRGTVSLDRLTKATSSASGYMSKEYAAKLDGISVGAQVNRSITNSRGTNNSGISLSAKGMYDHVRSGDHDSRYDTKSQVDTKISNALSSFDVPVPITIESRAPGSGDGENGDVWIYI